MDVAGREHRPIAPWQLRLVQTTQDSALAASQLLSYLGVHSKSLSCCGAEKLDYSSNTATSPRDFDFFRISAPPSAGGFAWLRPSGRIAANFIALRQAEQQVEALAQRREKQTLEAAVGLNRWCNLLVAGAMLAAGFHRPGRHAWRKWNLGRKTLTTP
jgi:hypothetical protein